MEFPICGDITIFKKFMVSKHFGAGQWWRTPLIPALGGRGRLISEFKASLVYRVSSRTSRAIQRNPVSKGRKEGRKEGRQAGGQASKQALLRYVLPLHLTQKSFTSLLMLLRVIIQNLSRFLQQARAPPLPDPSLSTQFCHLGALVSPFMCPIVCHLYSAEQANRPLLC
jgi:hypothetical protein